MIRRIPELLVWLLLFVNLLLASCNSMGDTAGARKPPATPEKVQVRVSERGLQVFWGNVPGATHYTVFWGPESGQYKNMGNSATNSALISDLVVGDLYYVAVTSWNARGESNYSTEQAAVYDTNPARADVYVAKGNEAMKRGLAKQAHAYFSAAIRLDPENVDAYLSRAVLYQKINRNELADKDHKMAEKLQKNYTVSTRVSSK